MFLKGFVFACMVGCIYALSRGDLVKYGPFHAALNSRYVKCSHNRNLNLNVSRIRIHFYDFSKNFHKSFPIKRASETILDIKNLDKRKKFVMFVGGFKSHINHSVEKQMRRAYKNYPNSYLIIPDHSAYTNNTKGSVRSYRRSVAYVHYIGKALGQLLADLHINGVSPKNIHCVGHSLGGQILGHTGSTFLTTTGKKIMRITALDPAGPCFTYSAIEDQVRSGVAEYVEVYHCNAGALGSSSVIGDVDFFMNKNGASQPNCRMPVLPSLYASSKAASCNHRVCVDLWTASVKHPQLFTAYSCDSYDNYEHGNCKANEKTIAGAGNPGTATGQYYLSTDLGTLA